MQKNALIAVALSVVVTATYFGSAAINTRMITNLSTDGFALFYIVAALLGGFIAYSFSSLIENRIIRRLVFITSFSLALFASGNAYRAIVIQRLFAQQVSRHEEMLPVAQLKIGSVGLQSPYTRTIYYLPTTIVPASQFAGFAYVGRCARVGIEETPGGAKRIVGDQAAIGEADIGSCPAR